MKVRKPLHGFSNDGSMTNEWDGVSWGAEWCGGVAVGVKSWLACEAVDDGMVEDARPEAHELDVSLAGSITGSAAGLEAGA